jgi:DNA-binding transcriptional regulator PaaX
VVADDLTTDVRALVDELGLQGHVALWLADPADGVDFGPLVSRWWDIPALIEREEEILLWLERFSSEEARDQLGDRDAFLIRTTMLDEVYGLSLLDPAIPSIELPRHAGLMALTRQLDAALLEPARRYFRARTGVPAGGGRPRSERARQPQHVLADE